MASESSKAPLAIAIPAKGNTNGVLHVTAAQTAGKTPPKTSNPRLKVVVRRLAPGLTEAEFNQIVGEEWAVGRGKVDWFSYKPGKESKDPSKPSRPSRAYFHLTHNDHLMTLSEAVRNSSFEDARNTWNNSCLIGPPSVEFAPYGRVPSGKRRNDARQGTIDQDADFMDFLESLANPAPIKEPAAEASGEEERAKNEPITTTPLVQYLKDKKANKGKEAAATTKAGKPITVKANSKSSSGSSKESSKDSSHSSSSPEDTKKKGKDANIEKIVGKATKEVVKVLNREAAAKIEASNASGQSSALPPAVPESPAKTPRAAARERGGIAAAAKLIQRDLGLSSSSAHRKAKANFAVADAKAAAAATTGGSSSSQETQRSATPIGPQGNTTESRSRGRGNRGASSGESAASKASGSSKDSGKSGQSTTPAPMPIVTLLKKPAAEPPSQPASPSTPLRAPIQPKNRSTPKPPKVVTEGATRAFVKHANPSQGITEVLLKEALEAYGATSMVEIDRKKGFAFVDFVDADGLVKAMKANPIKVANGTVQVSVRKDREPQKAKDPKARESPKGAGDAAKGGLSSSADQAAGNGTNGGGGGRGRNGGRGAGGTVGRNRGRNGGGGAGNAEASSSSSTPTTPAPSASKEVVGAK